MKDDPQQKFVALRRGRSAADIKGQATQRVIWKIAANEHDQLADISTLADP